MLRSLYRTVLHLHPPFFRLRFADEMLSIFDRAQSRTVALALFIDALISLVRQWTLRPAYWEEPAPVPAEGATSLFSSLASSKPRALALVSGAILSALALNGVSLTIGYAWEHPIFIPIRRPTIVPPAAWKTQPIAKSNTSVLVEPYLYTDQGRVLLVFNAPSASKEHPAAQPSAHSEPLRPPTPIPPAPPNQPSAMNSPEYQLAEPLQAYAGTYIIDDHTSARVAVDHGALQLEIAGKFRSSLSPLPRAQMLSCEIADCWVRFGARGDGSFDRLEIHNGGREIVAYRAQSGMVF